MSKKNNEGFLFPLSISRHFPLSELLLGQAILPEGATAGPKLKLTTPQMPLCSLFVTPKFRISTVFSFSWGHFNSQEKLKTLLMQNFGATNKEHYGMLW